MCTYVYTYVCVCGKHQSRATTSALKLYAYFYFLFAKVEKKRVAWVHGWADCRQQLRVEVSKTPSGGGRWLKFTSITMRNERKFVECAKFGWGDVFLEEGAGGVASTIE